MTNWWKGQSPRLQIKTAHKCNMYVVFKPQTHFHQKSAILFVIAEWLMDDANKGILQNYSWNDVKIVVVNSKLEIKMVVPQKNKIYRVENEIPETEKLYVVDSMLHVANPNDDGKLATHFSVLFRKKIIYPPTKTIFSWISNSRI